ncbi:hypothetical protein ACIRP0_02455 [Streptomyces sp. NPDC101733]|uniref:DUF3885 domain-containing protein n=1 Tax=unclassified Streptomyces TaxID=2593676 RepID=UPI0038083332
MEPDPRHEELTRLWRERWSWPPPRPHELKTRHADRWVRLHSLPGSKRHPEDEAEYGILLDRYNTVLDGLFAGGDVFVVSTAWSDLDRDTDQWPARRARHPEGTLWTTVEDTSDEDPEFHARWYFHADRRPWRRGCADGLLRAVANDELAGVFLTDAGATRVHHPYDGGADVVLATSDERDRLRERHADWLSARPSGY